MLKFVRKLCTNWRFGNWFFTVPYISIKKLIVKFTSERFQMVCESEDDQA